MERIRRLSARSLFHHCKYVIGFKDMELQPHWELCNFLIRNFGYDQLILLPRGTFKSSVISVGFPTWLFTHTLRLGGQIINGRDLRILESSEELENIKNFLGLIRGIVENNRVFRDLHGDLQDHTGVWHKTALQFAGRTRFRAEQSMTGASVRVSKVSQHYDLFIGDDLQNDKNVSSREMIDEVMSYIERMLPILDPLPGSPIGRGPRILTGTRWHYDDVYGRIIASEKARRRAGKKPAWRMLIRKAVTRKGTVYFPTRFSASYLKSLRDESGMTRYLFSCQYLNDPQPDEDQVFRLKDFGFFHSTHRVWHGVISPMPKMLNFFTTVDPSMGETEGADFTSCVTDGVDSGYNMYAWEVLREHLVGNEPIIQRLFEIRERYQPVKMGIETVVFQKALYHGFVRACRASGQWFHIDDLETDNKVRKTMRLRGFQSFVASGQFFLRVHENTDLTLPPEELYYALVPGSDVLAYEMISFPIGGTDDCLDAQAYMPQLIFPASPDAPPPGPETQEGTFAEFQAMVSQRRRKRGGLLTVR